MNGLSLHQKQFLKLQTYQMNLVSIQNNIFESLLNRKYSLK